MKTPASWFVLPAVAALLGLAVPPAAVAAPPRDVAGNPAEVGGLPPTPPQIARRAGALLERLRLLSAGADEREDIISALIDLGPGAIGPLAAEMNRRDAATWSVAVFAIGAIGDVRAVPTLRRALAGASGPAAMELRYALSLAGDDGMLALALRSPNPTMTLAGEATAIDCIAGAIGPPAVPVLVREIPNLPPDARIAGLGALGTLCDAEAVPFLLRWSRQPSAADRRYALMALARIGDPAAEPRMVEALSDPDEPVRDAATEGVGYLRASAAVPALLAMLDDPAARPRRERALWSLGLIGGRAAAGALAKALDGAEETERALILKALGMTADDAAIEALGHEAMSSHAFLATTAVRSLASIPGDASRDQLLAACSDAPAHEAGLVAARELVLRRDPRAMPCVQRQLRIEIDRRHGLDPVADDMLNYLPLAAAGSAASSLETAAEGISAPALQHRVLETAQLIRMVAETGDAVEPWLRTLQTGTPSEVDLAIMRLADLGDPRAVEPLENLFGRIEPDRAWRIPDALGRLRSERVTVFLVQLLTDRVYRVPALARARAEAARALARNGASPHATQAVRRAFVADPGRLFVALLAYARLSGASAIPDLLKLNAMQLRVHGPAQILRHEKVNWAIRMLRDGREIPQDELRDVD